ncbi:MAG: hypothetical protein DRP54_07830 [Spirochaetes bacterium]|nr:MAG: hypothetical protein DRP54_07830 [Spirochaetota bacterium]
MKILVINLMRFGDIIQCAPLLHALKEEYPGAEVHLLVNSVFGHATSIIYGFDKLHIIDYEKLYGLTLEEKKMLPSSYKYLRDIFQHLRKEAFDLVINITPSNVGIMAASLTKSKQIHGSYMDEKGLRVINTPWMRYFHTACKVRQGNNINLVDLFVRGGGPSNGFYPLKVKVEESCKERIQQFLDSTVDYRIAFHLGASERRRTWEPKCFARVARMLKKDLNVQFILVGVDKEKDLALEFAQEFSWKFVNLVGKTDLMTLAAVLSEVDLLICHDSGPMHVASGVGTKVLSIFLATANPHETGPYGPGHIIIEPDLPCHPCDHEVRCDHYSCRKKIEPRAVGEIARSMLLGTLPDISGFEGIRVFRSRIGDDGMVELVPLRKLGWTLDRFAMLLWRCYWPVYIERAEPEKQIVDRLEDRLDSYFGRNEWLNRKEEIREQINVFDELIFLAEEGEYYCRKILDNICTRSPDFCLINNWAGMLGQIDQYIKEWGYRNPSWMNPVQTFFLGKQSISGGSSIKEMAEESKASYTNLLDQIRGLRGVIQKLLGKEEYHGYAGKDGWEGNSDSFLHRQSGGASFASHGG